MNLFERRVLWALFALVFLLNVAQVCLSRRFEVSLRLVPDVAQSP